MSIFQNIYDLNPLAAICE